MIGLELIYMIKRQQREVPIRPVIDASLIADLNSGIVGLIDYKQDHSPPLASSNQRLLVRKSLSASNRLANSEFDSKYGWTVDYNILSLKHAHFSNESLMDHVFRILEHYTTTLQEEVEERTRELLEEKKRSDVLLYRLLPRQIAVNDF